MGAGLPANMSLIYFHLFAPKGAPAAPSMTPRPWRHPCDRHPGLAADWVHSLLAVSALVVTMLDAKLLEILVCPVTKASLTYKADRQELWCRASGLAYPVRDDIPVMLEAEARQLTDEERASLRA